MRTPVKSVPASPIPPRRSRAIQPPSREHPAVAWQLLEDYNTHRARCSTTRRRREEHKIADFKPSDDRLDVLGRVAAWCDEKRVDARLWLYVLFREHGWFWPPKLNEKALTNAKHLPAYHRVRGLDAYRRHANPSSRARTFDPNVDLAPANELRKQGLLDRGQAEKCMDLMVEGTLGYHPRSEACRRCPLAEPCAARLEAWCVGFDVVGLRLGRVSREQARAQAEEAQRRGRR